MILLMSFFVPESYRLFSVYMELHVRPGPISFDMVTDAAFSMAALIKSLFTAENILNPFFWLFLVLAACISTHIALSKEDLKGAAAGVTTLFLLLLLFNIFGAVFGLDSHEVMSTIAGYHAYTLVFSSLAVLFSCMTFGMCFLLCVLKKGMGSR
ncbi:hypothetical protein BTO30_09615 [Domibacillus antri]|uniref:Uncharacterized protein n=1 Tax=Domibacillus antri TaxID=1714264 RepID=A0A1Q8Q5C1_9BACI|nr:hypothetical protein [Domibacillus antri]OLN22550.1 hypothetical protein BTO30_09615 [Domibacillus antri]